MKEEKAMLFAKLGIKKSSAVKEEKTVAHITTLEIHARQNIYKVAYNCVSYRRT
jgi:hypothetical protein